MMKMVLLPTRENPAQFESWETSLSRVAGLILNKSGLNASEIGGLLDMTSDKVSTVLGELLRQSRTRIQLVNGEATYQPYSEAERKQVYAAWYAQVHAAKDVVSRESIWQSEGEPAHLKRKLAEMLKASGRMTLSSAAASLNQPIEYIRGLAFQMQSCIKLARIDMPRPDYQLTFVIDCGYKNRPTSSEFQQSRTFVEDVARKRVLAPWDQGY